MNYPNTAAKVPNGMPVSIEIGEQSLADTTVETGFAQFQQSGADPSFFGRLRKNRLVLAMAIFITALTLRIWQNSSLEHRLWYCADAGNYLRSGRALNLAFAHATSMHGFIDYLQQDAKKYSGMYGAFGSDNLVDRLSIDGPIFPLYLSAVENLVGVDSQKPQYEAAAFKISIANSVLDSLTCVVLFSVGCASFGPGVGVASGIMYALYPAAIVNTQWCMSETFSAFMLVLSVWSLTRLVSRTGAGASRLLLDGTVCGFVLGLTTLTRPVFPLLLPLVLGAVALYLIVKNQTNAFTRGNLQRLILTTAAMSASFLVAVAPWLLYTQAAFGQASLGVKRLPAYNLISGNVLAGNGWTPFPSKLEFPEDLRQSGAMILADAAAHPGEFALLECKKVARLWSGVWNDCKYSVLGIPVGVQTILHQLLLFLSFMWFATVLSRAKAGNIRGREVIGSVIAGSIIFAHALYLAFISMNRYAFTSMPFVALTAGAMAVHVVGTQKRDRIRFVLMIAGFILVVALTDELRSATSFVAGFVPADASCLVPWLVSGLAMIGFALVWGYAYRCSPERLNTQSTAFLVAGYVVVTLAIIGSIVGSYTWTQWSTPLTSSGVSQRLFVPSDLGQVDPVAMLIVDLKDEAPLPRLKVELNGVHYSKTPV
ncbi:MAG: hypothetical protein K2Z81_07315, partial [Cyanobacteria bacterium]|nr:hypothetical protein [Cyanobacteriota bacterium]